MTCSRPGFVLLGIVLMSACDRGPKIIPITTASVSGTATYQGKPLEDYRVYFFNSGDAAQEPAVGRVSADGKFELTIRDRKGAVVGPNKVWLVYEPEAPEQEPGKEKPFTPPPPKVVLPKKYTTPETSDLTAEVPAAGIPDFKIDLQ